MANYKISGDTLTGIADAIRAKNGSSDTYTPAQMATAILEISSGVSLEDVIVLIADYTDVSTYTITEGAYYDVKRAIVTI